MHLPLTQVAPDPHWFWQEPQLFTSLPVSVHWPLHTSGLSAVQHLPAKHPLNPAFPLPQALLQEPQLIGSVFTSVHPFPGLPTSRPEPKQRFGVPGRVAQGFACALHVPIMKLQHFPPSQVSSALASAVQSLPHNPQF